MMRRLVWLFGLCLPTLSFAGAPAAHLSEKDALLGEVHYYGQQGKYMDALFRLDIIGGKFYAPDPDAPNLDPLHFRFDGYDIALGDLELSYRMFQRAEKTLKEVYEKYAVEELIRNEAAYRLARVYLLKGEPKAALQMIEKVSGKLPEDDRENELFLRSQIYLANGKFAAAVNTLRRLLNEKNYKAFASYNLGVALIMNGQEKEGTEQLDLAGQLSGTDEVTLSIKDKANLMLGYRLMDAKQHALAKQYFDRVRLNSPFSNKALLGSGWAEVAMGKFDSALVPWSVLSKRNVADKYVQESIMGVPYAYAMLKLPGKAALMYDKALKTCEQELAKVDASIKSVREGRFRQTLLREEFRQDENWVARVNSLPETPEISYLLELIASSNFVALSNSYRDLDELLNYLDVWDDNLNAYEDIKNMNEALLPGIDKEFSALADRLRKVLEERQQLDDKIKKMLASPQPANGKLLAETYKRLQLLSDDVRNSKRIYASFNAMRVAALRSNENAYKGYGEQLRQLDNRVHDTRQKIKTVMGRLGNMLDTVAMNELNQRRKQLQDYQAQAKFGLAETYERASKAQAPSSGAKPK